MRESKYPQMKIIETNEFLLRPMKISDAQDVFEFYQNPKVVKYLPLNAHRNINDTTRFIKKFFIRNYRLGKIGHLAIVSKKDNKVIGHIGLNNPNRTDKVSQIGIILSPSCWGDDLATPLTVASLMYAFDYLNMNKLVAETYENNKYTRKSLESLGFKYKKVISKKIINGMEYNLIKSDVYELDIKDYLKNKEIGIYKNISPDMIMHI